MDPICARIGSDLRPQRPSFRGGRERLPQIRRHRGFQCFPREFQRDNVACVCAGGFAQLSVDFEPMAFLAVRLKRGSKRGPVNRCFDRCHSARRKLGARVLWQNKKTPRAILRGRLWPNEFRFETDFRSGLSHFCLVYLLLNAAVANSSEATNRTDRLGLPFPVRIVSAKGEAGWSFAMSIDLFGEPLKPFPVFLRTRTLTFVFHVGT